MSGKHVRFALFCIIAALLLTPLGVTKAAFVPGNQPARLVLGQPDFTSNSGDTTADLMFGPTGVTVDPATGKVFVAEWDNKRVLRFASARSLSSGAAAEAVLCQANFTSASATSTNCGAETIVIDSAGRLWVSDYDNHRVLRFDNAATITSGTAPSAVLGQPDFTTTTYGASINQMRNPDGIFVDSNGALWVADSSNHRVLRFDDAANKVNGANADGVLGQPDFNSSTLAITQSGMYTPYGVLVDAGGRLWVTDYNNCRVLRFDNAAGKANGADADGVLGQPDFDTKDCAAQQNRLDSPTSVTVDNATGTLYVSDHKNNRILGFNNAASKDNGANADFVMGQADFTSDGINAGGGNSAPTASSLYQPWQVFFDQKEKTLWVADYYNARVLMFGAFTSVFKSQGANDGWVLESDHLSSQGGSLNSKGTTINLGNDAQNREYRSILSFKTSALAGKTITKVTLRLKQQGVVGGGNPVTELGGFVVDIKKGMFGKSASLQLGDYQAKANKSYGAFKPTPSSGWYSINLTNGKGFINKTGVTQIRIRFKLDDIDNTASFLKLHSGNASSANRPQLVVEFYTP